MCPSLDTIFMLEHKPMSLHTGESSFDFSFTHVDHNFKFSRIASHRTRARLNRTDAFLRSESFSVFHSAAWKSTGKISG